MEDNIPKFDLPVDFIVGNSITGEILNQYGRFPCKIKAGIFVLCVQGTVHATVNLTEFTIQKNDFITLPPGCFIQIHEVSDDENLCLAGYSTVFVSHINYIKTITNYLPVIFDSPIMPLPEHISLLYQQAFDLLINAYSMPKTIENKEIIKAIFTIFMQGVIELYRNHTPYSNAPMTRNMEICREFVQLAMENYTKEHSVSYYAKRLNITLQHFCYVIKKVSGRTALDILSNIIIMDAKAQLKSTDMPVKKIAFALGFDNLSFFNKYFRQHVGMTPQEYRES